MSAGQTIANFMVENVISVSSEMDISHAVGLLLDRKISGAPVIEDTGELVGMLTKKDCFKAALNASYYKQWGGTVAHYMSRDVQTLDPGLDIVTAAETFLRTPYRIFPVTRDDRIVGVLSRSDLLRAFRHFEG